VLPASTNRFSRATFVRLGDNTEVVQLAPNLVSALDRPASYYQQRRLFPAERVKDPDGPDKTEQLTAKAVSLQSSGGNYSLTRSPSGWQLQEPVIDRVDPDKLKTILTALPDVWADQFVDATKKDLTELGLKPATDTIRVTREGGAIVTLLVGKQSQVKTRTVMRPPPPGGPPGMPRQPQPEVVHDEYRYAMLQDNDQIFEVKADKIKTVDVGGRRMAVYASLEALANPAAE
jgi:hypothetical protein